MKKQFDLTEWIALTGLVMGFIGIFGYLLTVVALVAYEIAVNYKYGILIEMYIIISGVIAYWLMKKDIVNKYFN